MKIVKFKDGTFGVRRGFWPLYQFAGKDGYLWSLELSNLQTLCRKCNCKKGIKI